MCNDENVINAFTTNFMMIITFSESVIIIIISPPLWLGSGEIILYMQLLFNFFIIFIVY